jgi:hypothetical protein
VPLVTDHSGPVVCCSLRWPAGRAGALNTRGAGQADVFKEMSMVQPAGGGVKLKVSLGPHTSALHNDDTRFTRLRSEQIAVSF